MGGHFARARTPFIYLFSRNNSDSSEMAKISTLKEISKTNFGNDNRPIFASYVAEEALSIEGISILYRISLNVLIFAKKPTRALFGHCALEHALELTVA